MSTFMTTHPLGLISNFEFRISNFETRVSGSLRLRFPWFRNVVVAGPEGPAYKGCQETCRRVLQGPPPFGNKTARLFGQPEGTGYVGFEIAAHPHGRRDACPTNPGRKPYESLWGRRPACQESGWVTSRCWRKA